MICDRVGVMYLGKVVELGDTEAVFSNPRHPYTRSLLAAIPHIGEGRITENFWLEGEPPDPGNLPTGCCFRPRCPIATGKCAEAIPPLVEHLPGHSDACLMSQVDA
jgi:oligopeptide/dipeptide ABC transporter ATP-binding protein